MKTPYHSAYWAHALTLRGPRGSIESLSRSLSNARVDLNPHQIDASLFAVRSPFSRGVLLADEVGLGKTIEAGIVIAQRWAERARRVLLIVPATLRKQWQQELEEKFSLPTTILESASYNQSAKTGKANPLEQKDRIVICSYHFAAAKAVDVKRTTWDLVVIDEAHRLRNIYKPGNVMASAIVDALAGTPKLLLTATPLQNTLLELYGLMSVIDPHVFGDMISFREQFLRASSEGERNAELKRRLEPLCRRTLRKQVLEYIRFTQRVPITQEFLPTDAEQQLYEEVSAYLQRDVLHALPASQRSLMTLVLRKLLASSTFAIAGTLRGLVRRLEQMGKAEDLIDQEDFEAIEELEDERSNGGPEADEPKPDPGSLKAEIAELRRFADLAERIHHNAKGDALLDALKTALDRAQELGAARKAVIFTESRRTQRYLHEFLGTNGYAGQMVLINGSNTDEESTQIYRRWLDRHAGSDQISGSRSADTKAALVEEFRDRATLLIATESAAEGVNLQFASLVVNYDLPWNPQRIEQRIGRCHRYGQQHDVVVVNFLNKRNAADQRVYQLLAEKFRLFDGVFGASDEVLGALESGVDLERRIVQVYQECRTPEEIQAAFDALQAELDAQIDARMTETRRMLLENFDEEVHARLRVYSDSARRELSLTQRWLLDLARQELGAEAQFGDDGTRFHYTGGLDRPGTYNADWKDAERRDEIFFRPDHPLAQRLVGQAIARPLPPVQLTFDYRNHGTKISALEPFIGYGGWLAVTKLTVESVETEEHLVLIGASDDGRVLDDDHCRKLLSLDAIADSKAIEGGAGNVLAAPLERRVAEIVADTTARNARHFDEEVMKLDRWAEDLKLGLEREIKELDREIRDTRRAMLAAAALQEKLAVQKHIKELETRRSKKRRELFESQDAIDQQRDTLISQIEQQLRQRHSSTSLFNVRWEIQ